MIRRPGAPPKRSQYLFILITLSLVAFVASTLTTTRLLRRSKVVEVPDLKGKSVEVARSLLRVKRLEFDISEFRFNQHTPANLILSQDPPAGQEVKTGRMVRVVVSRGSQEIGIPDVRGGSLRDAIVLLGDKGLNPGHISRYYTEEAPKNTVLGQWPQAAESMQQGGHVKLLVSAGPRPVKWVMPDLRGLSLDPVTQLARHLGIELRNIQSRLDDTRPTGTVLEQQPGPGECIKSGDQAALTISRRSEDDQQTGRYVTIHYRVPPGSSEVRVKFVVQDLTGRHEIHNAMERPSTELSLGRTVYGRATVTIWMNGQVVEEREL